MLNSEGAGIDFASFDAMLVPCASRVELYDGSMVGGDDDCIWDKDAVLNYFGSAFNTLAYYNQQEFKEKKFGIDDRIERYSELYSTFATTKDAHFTEAWVEQNELHDEVDLF